MPKLGAKPFPTVHDVETIPELLETIDPDTDAKARTRFLDIGDKILVGIDPGGVHVGWAEFAMNSMGTVFCAAAIEITPDEALENLERMAEQGILYGVAIENFTLQPDKAAVQFGSEMQTSEMIGALKWIVRLRNKITLAVGESLDDIIQIYMVSRNSKKAIRRQLAARGIRRVSLGHGNHAENAEMIGWYPILFHARDKDNSE